MLFNKIKMNLTLKPYPKDEGGFAVIQDGTTEIGMVLPEMCGGWKAWSIWGYCFQLGEPACRMPNHCLSIWYDYEGRKVRT